LGAVSNLPFGHLNAAWKAFIEGVAADEELWSFTAPWQTTWGRKEIRTGYVVVRGGSPAKHFLTMWKEIEDEPVDGKLPCRRYRRNTVVEVAGRIWVCTTLRCTR
jgi:hypothetical protein